MVTIDNHYHNHNEDEGKKLPGDPRSRATKLSTTLMIHIQSIWHIQILTAWPKQSTSWRPLTLNNEKAFWLRKGLRGGTGDLYRFVDSGPRLFVFIYQCSFVLFVWMDFVALAVAYMIPQVWWNLSCTLCEIILVQILLPPSSQVVIITITIMVMVMLMCNIVLVKSYFLPLLRWSAFSSPLSPCSKR